MKYMYKRVLRFVLKLEIGRVEVEMGRLLSHFICKFAFLPWQRGSKMTSFQSKMDFLFANSECFNLNKKGNLYK
jgi:hypothetical protein